MAKSAKRAKSAKSTRSARSTKSAKSSRSAKSARGGRSAGGAKKTSGAKKKKSSRKPNAAFMAPVSPSPALAAVVGAKPIPRTEVTKRLWAYIKKNGLQDAKNRRMIRSDEALRPVFGGKASVNMFEMTKLVSRHLK